MTQLRRIAGPCALAKTTTLHYPSATKEACKLLRESGIHALIGMFYARTYPDSLSYYLPDSRWPLLRQGLIYHDPTIDMSFAHNDLVLNQHENTSIHRFLLHLDSMIAQNTHAPFIQLMIHEQYFYEDYCDYQPDFEDKISSSLSLLNKLGYRSIFLEEQLCTDR